MVVTAAAERGKQLCGSREPGAVSTRACKLHSSLLFPSLPLESTNWNGIYLGKIRVLENQRRERSQTAPWNPWALKKVGQAASGGGHSGDNTVSAGTDMKRKANVQGTDCLNYKVWVWNKRFGYAKMTEKRCYLGLLLITRQGKVLSWIVVNNKTRHLCN